MNHAILRKIAAASAVVCDELGGGVDMFPLIKILYVSDRQMLIDYARPITGDNYSSMPKGPILSETYNFIKGKSKLTTLQARWNEAFSLKGNRISVKGKVNTDSLAPVEEKVLRETARMIQGIMETGNLADWMHKNCKEWEDVKEGSSKPLPLKRILRYAKGVEEKDAISMTETIVAAVRQRARSKLASGPLLMGT
ncbi:MAG: SocA family protein [Opitutae bacterium]|nr:SocA family protein [Opitutae bacterium]